MYDPGLEFGDSLWEKGAARGWKRESTDRREYRVGERESCVFLFSQFGEDRVLTVDAPIAEIQRHSTDPESEKSTMEKAVGELERVQTQILRRISKLELSFSPHSLPVPVPFSHAVGDTQTRLSAILRANGVNDFSFKKVPSDYYDWPLESRRDVLGASTIQHLCKSIVLVNTQAQLNVSDCSDQNNSKYYVVVIQYTARFNAETVKNFLYSLNNGKIAKKKFNMRLAPEETSVELTGYEHNAVTCIGMKTDIPVILDEAIVKLHPDFFWLGGGEIDLKLGIRTSEFIDYVKPFIVCCSGT